MASERYPVQPPGRQRVAAGVALALALVYPLTVAFYAFVIVSRDLSGGGNIVVESLYNALTYFEAPLPFIAALLARLVLNDSANRNRVAWAAAILGLLSMFAIAGVIIFLAFFAHGQSASSAAYVISMMWG